MNSKEETKNHSDSIRNGNENDYKREGHSKRMNKESTQYIRESVTNDHVSGINFQKRNPEKRLDKEKQDSNNVRTRRIKYRLHFKINKESKEDLLRTEKEKIIRKQRKVRSCNRTYIENNSFVITNINSTRETRDH